MITPDPDPGRERRSGAEQPAFAGVPVALGLQLFVAVAVLACAAGIPPRSGPILLVSLAGASTAAMVNLARGQGATLEGLGRLPGSLVVRGERDRLAPAMLRLGVLPLAAPPFLCATGPAQ